MRPCQVRPLIQSFGSHVLGSVFDLHASFGSSPDHEMNIRFGEVHYRNANMTCVTRISFETIRKFEVDELGI